MNEISKVFRANGIPMRVAEEQISFQTSKTRVFYLKTMKGAKPPKPSTIINLAPVIGEALTLAWNGRREVKIRTLPLRIESTRPDPVAISLLPAIKQIKKRGSGRPLLLMGETYDWDAVTPPNGKRRDATIFMIDMSQPASPHALVAGRTGGGKSKLLQTMILGMAAASSPKDLSFAVIDPKGVDFKAFTSLPHMIAPVAVTPGDSLALLKSVEAEVGRRQGVLQSMRDEATHESMMKALGPTIVIFVDEVADLVSEAEKNSGIEEIIRRVLAIGRGLKIHLVLATQKPSADYVRMIAKDKANIPLRVCGPVSTMEEAKNITGIPGSIVGAHLLGTADFVLARGADVERFHAFHLPDNEVVNAVAGVAKIWGKGQRAKPLKKPKPPSKASTKKTLGTPKNGVGPAEIKRRHDHLCAVVRNTREGGKTPTVAALKQYHMQKYGTAMNHVTAQKIMSEALT